MNNFIIYIEFNEGSDININIDNIIKNVMLDEKSIGRNLMFIEFIMKNGILDNLSKYIVIVMSLFVGIVIYSIYVILIY